MTSSQQPIDLLLEQIAELLRLTKEGKMQPEKLSPEMIKRLEYAEAAMEWLSELNAKTLKRLGFHEEKIKEIMAGLDQLSPKNRRILQTASRLQEEAIELKGQTLKQAAVEKQREKTTGKEGKAIIARKKKFQRVGGKKNWKPL